MKMKKGHHTNKLMNQDRIFRSHDGDGLERIEAFFQGHGYEPHRHDTYAIGITLSGVQAFNYRKSIHYSLPGQTMVIHPDELHDGEAGTEDGFLYRIAYIEPTLFRRLLADGSLPYVNVGLSSDPRLYRATWQLLFDISVQHDALERDDHLWDLAEAMQSMSNHKRKPHRGDLRAAQMAREYIHDNLDKVVTLDELAHISGRDRWNLSRDFRGYFATSPYRYLTMRRLDLVRRLASAGESLAESSAIAGFADQSHMTRQFVKTYGMSPARWLRTQSPADQSVLPRYRHQLCTV
ncbi:AraC family transcriptional regulator [Herbaspirillum sp. NPDC087042]|uniref:AraC family transcriptional regulator n=1 Tax=Herbaspirillum sp. NPDC087042 TaxID=3364004 RepID=UPI00382A0B92